MNKPDFGFYFERAGRGATQGAISPAEQFFEGSRAESSLVRETGQNSIDARAGLDPVTLVFELASVATADIPGINDLSRHLEQVEEQTRGSQGHASMEVAEQTARKDTIQVLRIGDYGTKGLHGTESIHDPKSPLSALTRGAGISADDGSRGGSFGIGSAVGPMASNMNTVLYTSLSSDGTEVIFAGYSCLATHKDEQGIWRVGDGFFTDRACTDDFSYLRNPPPITPFETRSEPGTDLYVLAYRMADSDPDLSRIKIEAMRNFLVAIDRGELIVIGKTPTSSWRLDRASLQEHVVEDSESSAFYRALKDPSPIIDNHPILGEIKLYISIDDTLERSMHTVTVRKPLMKIDTFKHTSIPVKYSALLECSGDEGNTLLRGLEPPEHNRWDPMRETYGSKIVADLKAFVRNGLKSRVQDQIGDQVQVKGLSKYLPDALFEDRSIAPESGRGVPNDGTGTDDESSRVRGREGAQRPITTPARKTVSVGVRTTSQTGGAEESPTGKKNGGNKKRKKKGGTFPGTGTPGNGTGRISARGLRFRSWSDASTGDICLALTPAEDVSGDLELVAVGPGGSIEEDYVLPIESGSIMSVGATSPVKHEGNTLIQLELMAGVTSQVRLTLSSNHRYRLGIK